MRRTNEYKEKSDLITRQLCMDQLQLILNRLHQQAQQSSREICNRKKEPKEKKTVKYEKNYKRKKIASFVVRICFPVFT